MASAGAPPSAGALLSATDFFGETDAGGIEKFKTVAFRALHEQKLEEELHETKQENERLKEAHAKATRELQELQESFDANIDDRERVLAFKSKRMDELNNKLREFEAINTSLLQTINGSGIAPSSANTDDDGISAPRNSSTRVITGSAAVETVSTDARARMMTLINAGRPLFHPLDTCKEQEYKQLYEEVQQQCVQLIQKVEESDAIVRKMQHAQFDRLDMDAQIKQLQAQLSSSVLEKDELEHHLERKLILENERLRREKEAELQAFHDAMRTQMRMQLDMTTQRTVEENERVQLELRYQSSQLEILIKQVDELRVENKRVKQEMHVFEEMNAGLSKKLKFYEQLFAKMQQKDEQRSKGVSNNQYPMVQSSPVGPPSRRTPRKPPLPSLISVRPPSPGSLPTYCPGSPHASFFSPNIDSVRCPDIEIDSNDPQSPYQLNAITDVLEKHLQSREFTKKQVVAVLRYHQDQYNRRESPKLVRDAARLGATPVLRKKMMLSKACYNPASYGRRVKEPPMTLDALIKQKTSTVVTPRDDSNNSNVDEEQRQILQALLLPQLSRTTASSKRALNYTMKDPSEMWKTSATSRQQEVLTLEPQVGDPPSTVRF